MLKISDENLQDVLSAHFGRISFKSRQLMAAADGIFMSCW